MFKHRVASVIVPWQSDHFNTSLSANGEKLFDPGCGTALYCLDLRESSIYRRSGTSVSLTFKNDLNRRWICDFHLIDEANSLMLVRHQKEDGTWLHSVLCGTLSDEGAEIFWDQTGTVGSLESDETDMVLKRRMCPGSELYDIVERKRDGPDLHYCLDDSGKYSLAKVQRMEQTYDQIECLDKVDYFETKILTDEGKVQLVAGVLDTRLLYSFDTKLDVHNFPLEVDGQPTKELVILERCDNFLFVDPMAYGKECGVGLLDLTTLQWTRLNIYVQVGADVMMRNTTLLTFNTMNIIRYQLEQMPLAPNTASSKAVKIPEKRQPKDETSEILSKELDDMELDDRVLL